MQRQRDGLVPIGEVIGGLGGPVKAIREASPQAVHHYTRFDQVNELVSASEAGPDMGFMARLMALCSLPRTNPGNLKEYVRRNGPYKLGMTAGVDNKLPFGNIPRLLLAWVCTEAVRTQRRELVLGSSLSKFMRKLGMEDDSGSPRGNRTRLRNQMDRLFTASVQLIYEDEHRESNSLPHTSPTEASSGGTQNGLTSRCSLTAKSIWVRRFFNEIIRSPVPLDMNILKALKRSSLGLDWYLWLTYRTFALRAPLRLSWQQLYRQFGAHPAQAGDKNIVNNFRTKALRELKKIKIAWPELNYATAKGVLILSPSKPVIPTAQQLSLVK